MADFDSARYPKNFLRQVIARIDFLQFLSNENVFCTDIEKHILKSFPKKGKDQLIRFNLTKHNLSSINGGEYREGIQCEYLSKDEKNKVLLSNKFIVFEVNQYHSFEEVYEWMKNIYYALFSENRIVSIRTGLRYINIYDAKKVKLQKNYFASEIASILKRENLDNKNGLDLMRSMHMTEYQTSSMRLNFRYGLFNPVYPNKIKDNSFVLDFDCFTDDAIESVDNILQCFKHGHKAIQYLFEKSISDKMRKVMKGE